MRFADRIARENTGTVCVQERPEMPRHPGKGPAVREEELIPDVGCQLAVARKPVPSQVEPLQMKGRESGAAVGDGNCDSCLDRLLYESVLCCFRRFYLYIYPCSFGPSTFAHKN